MRLLRPAPISRSVQLSICPHAFWIGRAVAANFDSAALHSSFSIVSLECRNRSLCTHTHAAPHASVGSNASLLSFNTGGFCSLMQRQASGAALDALWAWASRCKVICCLVRVQWCERHLDVCTPFACSEDTLKLSHSGIALPSWHMPAIVLVRSLPLVCSIFYKVASHVAHASMLSSTCA